MQTMNATCGVNEMLQFVCSVGGCTNLTKWLRIDNRTGKYGHGRCPDCIKAAQHKGAKNIKQLTPCMKVCVVSEICQEKTKHMVVREDRDKIKGLCDAGLSADDIMQAMLSPDLSEEECASLRFWVDLHTAQPRVTNDTVENCGRSAPTTRNTSQRSVVVAGAELRNKQYSSGMIFARA